MHCLLVSLAINENVFPYGLLCIQSYIKMKSPATKVTIKNICQREDLSILCQEIVSGNFDIVGFSAFCWSEVKIRAAIKLLRTIGFKHKIIVGGAHANLFTNDTNVDHICIGDGEEVLLNLLQNTDIFGRTIVAKPMVANRIYPFFDITLLRDASRKDSIPLETTSGCTFNCAYCAQSYNQYTERPLKNLSEEVAFLKENGIFRVHFLDATLNRKKSRFLEICKIMTQSSMQFHGEIKAELLDHNTMQALLNSSCASIEIGLQSACPETNTILKRPFNQNLFEENVSYLTNNCSFTIKIDTIIGLPNEGLRSWINTIKYLMSRWSYVSIVASVLSILPDTDLWKKSNQFGYYFLPEDAYKIRYSNAISQKEILAAQVLADWMEINWNQKSLSVREELLNLIQNKYNSDFELFFGEILSAEIFKAKGD